MNSRTQNSTAMNQTTEAPKDKTYYFEHNGEMVRVRASKKPSKETLAALKNMVDCVKSKYSKP